MAIWIGIYAIVVITMTIDDNTLLDFVIEADGFSLDA
jgi:hypothetical protein